MLPDSTILVRALPGFIIFMFAEVILLLKEDRYTESKKNVLASLGIGAVAIMINFLLQGIIIFVYSSMYQFRFFSLPSGAWWVWVICFFGDDLSYYWFHRMSHQVRFLWASHAVHHSSETFSLSAGIRIPWTSNLTGTFLFWAWMPLLGIEPGLVIFLKSLSVIYQFWIHTESIRHLPKWFEAIFNTPSHHRVHHSSDQEYLDKNHGGNLIIWDKLFGTFREETHPPKYGLTKNVGSNNPFVIAIHEWKNMFSDIKKAESPKDYINYVFNSPGWSKDGSTKTTRQLRIEKKIT